LPALGLLLLLTAGSALAHAVAEGDKGHIQEISGVHLIPFAYLGAKHMVTGYDHLLFLAGVIFFIALTPQLGRSRMCLCWYRPSINGEVEQEPVCTTRLVGPLRRDKTGQALMCSRPRVVSAGGEL
jgi:hypothetical protein